MTHPTMPSLYGQITQTIKANLKLILLFAIGITVFETALGGTLHQMLTLALIALADAATTGSAVSVPLLTFEFMTLMVVWSYIYPQAQIVAIDYHQQPPHQPRTPLWIAHKGFNSHYLRFCLHMLYIFLLSLSVMTFIGIFLTIGMALDTPLLALISGIFFFVAMIALGPLTATKLPAVIDPNGDTSFKASFARGKHIFWRFLGNCAMVMFSIGIIMGISIGIISFAFISLDLIDETVLTNAIMNVETIGVLPFFIFNAVQNIFTIASIMIYSVIMSHYYIWSEYYLPDQKVG